MTALDWLIRPIAHRGLHDAARGVVENTATAFKAALDAGYGIECDVQISADGEAMVFHDATLERLTASSGAVAALGTAALKKVAFRNGKDRIQTLPELLEQVDDRVPLVIELKSGWESRGLLEARMARDLERYDGHVAVMSFDPRSVAIFAEAAPHVARGLVACRFDDPQEWPGTTSWQRYGMRHLLSATIARPDFIAYDINALPAAAPVLGNKLLGWPLLTWTVRTPDQQRRARRWADAMIFEGFRP